ncbi:DUF4244 domain-containing protein [Pseudarthrobacter sp. L19]|uniref:DUF4244 domain-containing protein n=1 Tax=Pseudarthrobacter sp. L19 TaxID=3423951 RepID=UPI003D7B5BE4
MSFHPQIPGAPKDASADAASAEVREIYPGARQAPPVRSVSPHRSRRSSWRGSEAGMATAEYAIATLAAVGFAGLLVLIMRSDEVRGFLLNVIRAALALP